MEFKVGDKIRLLVDCVDFEGRVLPKGSKGKVLSRDKHSHDELVLQVRGICGTSTTRVEDGDIAHDTAISSRLSSMSAEELLEEMEIRKKKLKEIEERKRIREENEGAI